MKIQTIIILLAIASTPTLAADCSANLTGNDALHFSATTITVPSTCKKFTVTLKNTGTMARDVMGHNVVIAKSSDEAEIVENGANAGIANNYVKPNDASVIAYTKLIGGGETASTTFNVSQLKAGVSYNFFCTSPGHSSLMTGKVIVK